MSVLFDSNTLDFLSSRITAQEAAQIALWARNQLETKIDTHTGEARHLLNMVGYKTLMALEYLLLRNKALDKTAREFNLFVQYYDAYLQKHCVLSENGTSLEDRDKTKAQLQSLQQKLAKRQAKRENYLIELLSSGGDDSNLRLASLADWYNRSQQGKQQQQQKTVQPNFDLLITTFIEQMTQSLLEKSLSHLVFPAARQ